MILEEYKNRDKKDFILNLEPCTEEYYWVVNDWDPYAGNYWACASDYYDSEEKALSVLASTR